LDGGGVKTNPCFETIINNLLGSKAVSTDIKVGSELTSMPLKEVKREINLDKDSPEIEHDVPKLWRGERIKKKS